VKTVVVFNFDLPHILEEWKQEGHSAHHLWGVTELPKYGIDVELLPYEKFGILKKVSQKLKFLGDLDQQLRIFLAKDTYDVIYSAHHLTTALLAFLRKVKLLNKPIVAVAHRSFKKTLFSQLFTALFVEGNDKILCLSEATKEHLHNNFGISNAKLDVLSWCIDIQYEKFSDENIVFPLSESRHILSSGRTHRDYETLLSAFQEIDYSLRILGCSPISNEKDARSLYLDPSQVPKNISFVDRFIPTPEAIDEIKQAYAVAVPLKIYDKEPCSAIGLTSLLEAMAMAKAVVITRNEYIGIDVEKEQIGLVVEPGDVEGWKKAITFLLNNPDVAQEMGYRGRQLVKEKYNLDFFTKEVANYLHSVVKD
jgi:glycosyltransferase involved in cell wall biosynthesis